MKQKLLVIFDPNSNTMTANVLPLMSGISCKTLILQRVSLILSPFLHFAISQTFLLSLSAKVAAMFGLLKAAASTWRGMQQHCVWWFQPQPRGLMSLVRFCLLFLWLQTRCLLCGRRMEKKKREMRRHTASRTDTHKQSVSGNAIKCSSANLWTSQTEEKQDKNTAT